MKTHIANDNRGFVRTLTAILAAVMLLVNIPSAYAAEPEADARVPAHPGTQVASNACKTAQIDYSNADLGYVMVRAESKSGKALKCRVGNLKRSHYTYDLEPGSWVALPLTYGDGGYKVTIYENKSGNQYVPVLEKTFEADIEDENGIYLISNIYVNWTQSEQLETLAAELCDGAKTDKEKTDRIYDFVVDNIKYDDKLAETVQPGYVPDLDEVLDGKSGICFDYAALTAGMLRSQGVPCKLVFGYASGAYHAWVSVLLDDEWVHLDPTLVSRSNRDKDIITFANDTENYTELYQF